MYAPAILVLPQHPWA